MASSKDYLEYILDQLSGLDDITGLVIYVVVSIATVKKVSITK